MQIIILAAGKGSRMKSELPKVMHEVGGKPMLQHVIDNCRKVTDDLVLVYSDHIEKFLPEIAQDCKLVKQEEQLGTAHAVSVARSKYDNSKPIGVIYGDNPLITPEIIEGLFERMQQSRAQAITLAFEYDKPNAYGRIVLDEQGGFLRIVESKYASEQEKQITLCNSGIMAFSPGVLDKYIDECLVKDKEQPEKELYLTEIIEVCSKHGEKVDYYLSENHNLVLGVNTQDELKNANSLIEKSANHE